MRQGTRDRARAPTARETRGREKPLGVRRREGGRQNEEAEGKPVRSAKGEPSEAK